MQNFGQLMPREGEAVFRPIQVIACNKRKAFVQGSEAARQSILLREGRTGLLRFARNDGRFLGGSRPPTTIPGLSILQ
jgi:hypothetical protein